MGPSAESSMEDHITVIARHRPGLRRHVAVHRSSSLDSLAESDDALRAAKGHRLDDVMTAFRTVRNHREAQLLIDIRREDSTLQRRGSHSRRQEKALVKALHHAQRRSHLFSKPGRGQPVRGILHVLLLYSRR